MSSNLAMLDCWLLYLKAKLVVIQYFFQTSFKIFINALLYLTSRYFYSENFAPRRNRESGNLSMFTTNLVMSKLCRYENTFLAFYKVHCVMTSNYLGVCRHARNDYDDVWSASITWGCAVMSTLLLCWLATLLSSSGT